MSASVREPRVSSAPAERARLGVLLPYLRESSFVTRDRDLLASAHTVRFLRARSAGEALDAARALVGANVVVCWFGSTRFLPLAILAKLAGLPLAIIAGGYDLAALPEIEYGNMRGGLSRILGRWLFRLADRVACVSHAAAAEAVTNAGVPPGRVRVIQHGFDDPVDDPQALVASKQRLVLTVADIDASTLRRKGLLTVARTSHLLPDVPFVIAGRSDPEALAVLRGTAGPNVSFPGRVGDTELTDLFRRASVYFQPSMHEAFGCAVAEAMLFGCVPVVTPRFALPEVVGDAGLYAEPDDPDAMATALARALAGEIPAEFPRARVLREFPLGRRREALIALIDELHGADVAAF